MRERRTNGGRRKVDEDGPDWEAYRSGVRRTFKLVTVCLVLSGLAVLASLATYANSRGDESRAQQTREQLINIVTEIRSCTTPEGACAQRGQRSGQSISSAITYCTLNLPPKATRDVVKECIINELEEAQ